MTDQQQELIERPSRERNAEKLRADKAEASNAALARQNAALRERFEHVYQLDREQRVDAQSLRERIAELETQLLDTKTQLANAKGLYGKHMEHAMSHIRAADARIAYLEAQLAKPAKATNGDVFAERKYYSRDLEEIERTCADGLPDAVAAALGDHIREACAEGLRLRAKIECARKAVEAARVLLDLAYAQGPDRIAHGAAVNGMIHALRDYDAAKGGER